MKAGVVIVDDHPLVRERLAELINKEEDLFVCGQANSVPDGLRVIRETGASVVIVDLSLKGSGGLELIKALRAEEINIPALVLSMHDESLYAERALKAGARGYITKQAESDAVMSAIRQVLAGQVYLAQPVASKILTRLAAGESKKGINRLTDRELEVFELIGNGRTTRQISTALGLSAATVETYRSRIKEKLGLENANQLSAEAARWRASVPDQTAPVTAGH